MSFSDLGLAPELLQAIADQGYTEPTPVQAKAIPPILLGQDVMAAAQTGTGKTASFTLPMLQRLKEFANNSVSPARHQVRALILTPTRELAAQVQESVKTYGKHIALRSAVVYGGINIDPQIRELRTGVEILVATPGRLLDHLQQKTVNLSQVQFLVLDEADRMLDMGFLPDIKRILSVLPAQRQSVMFSATYSDDIRGLAKQLLKNPVNVEVARRNSTVDTVTHLVYHVDVSAKRDLLTHLIRSRDMRQVLVFCNTKIGANRLAYKLDKDGVAAAAIHSDRTQGERTQALAEFKEGSTQGAGRHRCRRARTGHRTTAVRNQLRPARFSRRLRAPHRPHRPRRPDRRGYFSDGRRRTRETLRDRKAAQDQAAGRRGSRTSSVRRHCAANRTSAKARRPEGRRDHGRRDENRHREARRPEAARNPPARGAQSADPLFSKPYNPPASTLTDVANTASRPQVSKKQVAALFLPPVAEKQDISS